MLTEEAQTLARHAKATWPTMNAETAGSLAADLRELDVRMAKCALAEMKAECTYFSFTEFSQRYARHKQAARKARQEAEREAEAPAKVPVEWSRQMVAVIRRNLDHARRGEPLETLPTRNTTELRKCRHPECDHGWLITDQTGAHPIVAPCPTCRPEQANRKPRTHHHDAA